MEQDILFQRNAAKPDAVKINPRIQHLLGNFLPQVFICRQQKYCGGIIRKSAQVLFPSAKQQGRKIVSVPAVIKNQFLFCVSKYLLYSFL